MEDIPDKNRINNYLLKIVNNVKDLYIDVNMDKYCDKIYKGALQKTQKREDLKKKNKNFIESNNLENRVLLLTVPFKIGKSISILDSMNNVDFENLYIDLNHINTLKDENKSSYIFNECFRLFHNYKKYYNFIKQNYNSFKNIEYILSFIINYIY